MITRVREAFQRRIKAGHKYPLLRAFHESFFWEFWLGGICALLSSILQVLTPFTLRYLIQFASDAWAASHSGSPAPPISNGIGLAIGITVMQMLQSLATTHFIYRGMMLGGEMRAVLIGSIFEKSMVISGRARAGGSPDPMMPETEVDDEKDEKDEGDSKKTLSWWLKMLNRKEKKGTKGPDKDGVGWGNGRIVNLMSVDTYRIDQASALFHLMWTGPIICFITLALLLVNLSYSALAGFALLVIGIPILTRSIKSLFRRRKVINKITDQRVSLTQEILQSVRFVKYFGWEKAFLGRLGDYRAKEIYAIQILLAIRNAINAVSISLPIFASMLSFICYSLTDNALNPPEIFSSLALFNGLRIPLNLLPLVLGQITDAWSSMKRIEEFLLEEEQEVDSISRPEGTNAIELLDASFTWERTTTQEPEKATDKNNGSKKKETTSTEPARAAPPTEEREPFKLHDLNLQAARNELIAVIGTVGSGKSSLLAALAGDMRRTKGDMVYGASRAFCPQYAWIQNTSLRNNITFGKDMDKPWYREVIKA